MCSYLLKNRYSLCIKHMLKKGKHSKMCVCHECLLHVLHLSVRKDSLASFIDERYITALLLLQLLRVKETPKSVIHLLKHSMICWCIN